MQHCYGAAQRKSSPAAGLANIGYLVETINLHFAAEGGQVQRVLARSWCGLRNCGGPCSIRSRIESTGHSSS